MLTIRERPARTAISPRRGRWALPYGMLVLGGLGWMCCARGVDETDDDDLDPPADGAAPDGSGGSDAGAGGAGEGGAGAASGRCDRSLPFGTPSLLPNVNSVAEEYAARLSVDELTIYIASDRPTSSGDIDVYAATRSSPTADFDTPQAVTSVNTTFRDINPSVTGDGLALFLQSTRPSGPGSGDIYVATRTTVMAGFGTPEVLAGVNDPTDDGDPYVLPDGETIYFASLRRGTYDIYRSERQPNGTFAAAVELASVNTVDAEVLPVPSSDELTLYFASNRAGSGTLGEMDIWVAQRTSPTEAFGAATVAAQLNSAVDDRPTWLSTDGCVLYLVSDRPGSSGERDIWIARRP